MRIVFFNKRNKAQSILEFTAGMIALSLIVYGMIEVFRWGMMDMAERRYDHDAILSNKNLTTEQQVNPNFHEVRTMDTLLYKK